MKRLLQLALLVVPLLAAAPVRAAIAFDGTANSSGQDGTAVTGVTFAHTVTSATNGVLTVGCSLFDATLGNRTITGITYNGSPLTLIRSDDDGGERTELWYLLAPSVGTNNVIVTMGGTVAHVVCGSVSLTGVAQTTPQTNAGTTYSSQFPTVSLTTGVNNAWAVDVFSDGNGTPVVTMDALFSRTQEWNTAGNTGIKGAGSARGPIAGNQAMSWSVASSVAGTLSAVAFAPAGTNPPYPATAFLGAQGGGSASLGGHGGQAIEVTNLNDSGAGSLRACVDASGARTCVFRVAGTIYLATALHVLNPYLTIAGQTAPGGGIQLTNNTVDTDDLLRIGTHDVTVRYLRSRNQFPNNGASTCVLMSINSESSDVYNVIFDHISTAYGIWDNGGVWSTTNPAFNITFQWTIQAEPVYIINHSVNDNFSGSTSAMSDRMHDVDFHHNFLTGADHRNPISRVWSARIASNLVYNAAYYDIKIGGNKDVLNNYIKGGPYTVTPLTEIQTWTTVTEGTTAPHSLYISGNAADSNSFNSSADQWSGTLTGMAIDEDNSDTVTTPIPPNFKRTTPLANAGAAISPDLAASLAAATGVLLPVYPNSLGTPGVGASARLDCSGRWVGNRDPIDATFVTQFLTNTGHSGVVVNPPVLPQQSLDAPCTSTAHDGLPDAWKMAQGFAISDTTVATNIAPSGYTYLEMFLNGPDSAQLVPAAVQVPKAH